MDQRLVKFGLSHHPCRWVAIALFLVMTPVYAQEKEEEDWATMIVALRQQLHHMPHHPKVRKDLAIAHNNYGVSLSEQEKFAEAIQQLQEAMQLDPSNTQF